MQALAALDAVISPEWEYRYFSFNSRWDDGEMMGSRRNVSGDEMFVLFNDAGVFIKGFDHERWDENLKSDYFYDSVPPEFASGTTEPAFSPNLVTFCCWRSTMSDHWDFARVHQILTVDDGSSEMMSELDDDPASYLSFARDYYEEEFDVRSVAAIYRHTPMTLALATSLNSATDYPTLIRDLSEIGYPIGTD